MDGEDIMKKRWRKTDKWRDERKYRENRKRHMLTQND